jgi:hypothetical protein
MQARLSFLTCFLGVGVVGSAQADVAVTVGDLELTPGGDGVVEVRISGGGDGLAAFGFQLLITPEEKTTSYLEFNNSQPDPTSDSSYVLSGNSIGYVAVPAKTVTPNDTLNGGDSTADGGTVPVAAPKLLARLKVAHDCGAADPSTTIGHAFTMELVPSSGLGGPNTFFLDGSSGSIQFTSTPGRIEIVRQPPLVVSIDIKPGSYPNPVNLGSPGVVPVAILSSDTFDAALVDPQTVELAGAAVATRGKDDKYRAHEEDANGDGLLDLVCQVETENLDPGQIQDGKATLTGQTSDGRRIQGWDEVILVPRRSPKK